MKDQVTCPNCGDSFDIEEALSGKLKAHFRSEYEKKLAEQAKSFKGKEQKLKAEQKALAEKSNSIDLEVAKLLEKEKKIIEKSSSEAFETKIKALEKVKIENKKFREQEVKLLQRESDVREKEEDLELQTKKKLLEGQKEIEAKVRKQEEEKFKLEKTELLKKIEDNKKLAEEMKRKAEQGSMQLQGESQELVLSELLSQTYPFDEIYDVPTGVKGADLIQTVINSEQKKCGTIIYESKNTKSFSSGWITKLKKDQLSCKADISVIVTKTLPSDIEKFGQKNGIWICGFQEARSLSFVLREMLIQNYSIKLTQENKSSKIEFLYNYLTSNEFVQNIKQIIETYDAMNQQLNSEKRAMQKIWSTRETQMGMVQESIASLFGSIKGIAGKELQTSNILELPSHTID